MKLLRAAEHGILGELAMCLQRFPHLANLVDNQYEIGGNVSVRLRRVREHAVCLANEKAKETAKTQKS